MAGIVICCTSGCNKLPDGGVPIYVHIDSPTVVSMYPFGAGTFTIPSVWASSASHNLGAYEMPVDIPVLASGNVSMAVSAGISDNGIISAPVMYPFYRPDTFTIYNAIPGHVYHHHPVYTYFANAQVAINADFEAANLFSNISRIPAQGSTLNYGLTNGGIILPSAVDSVTSVQTSPVAINTNGREAYMELDYKMNDPTVFCDVGIVGTLYAGTMISEQTTYDKIVLYPSATWNKVYLNFNNEIGGNSDQNYVYQVYFIANHATGRQDTMFLDNIKLIYFH